MNTFSIQENLAVLVAGKVADLVIAKIGDMLNENKQERKHEHVEMLERIEALEKRMDTLCQGCPYLGGKPN